MAASVAPLVSAPIDHTSNDIPQVNWRLNERSLGAGRRRRQTYHWKAGFVSQHENHVCVSLCPQSPSQQGMLEEEELQVLKECLPAQSIGKTVVDKGYLFRLGSISVPYLGPLPDVKRCRLRIPRNARLCASKVVGYVPQ